MHKTNDVIRSLTENEFQEEVAEVFTRIFQSDDIYGEPFRSTIPKRAILFDVGEQPDEEPLLSALTTAVLQLGDTEIYATIIGRPPACQQRQPYHWCVPITQLVDYGKHVGPLENMLYSRSGSWGMMLSYEHFALLGGCAKIMQTINAQIPNLDDQVFGFLDYWQYYHNQLGSKLSLEWLPKLMTHIYGAELAKQFLKQGRFADLAVHIKDGGVK